METQDQSAFMLALHRAPGVGAIQFQRLLDHFGSAQALFRARACDWQAAGIKTELSRYLQNPDWKNVENDLAWLEKTSNTLICLSDPEYPALLKEIHDSPALLFVHGDASLLARPQLAIVGSRNPSHAGAGLAKDFAAYLSNCGLAITSGLATGIDAAAHRGALESHGTTLAVTGTGLDRVYPARHRDLAHEIASSGALVSEYPTGTAPLATNFPRRNRIISGLSLGTLVVEAALRSGSLITARTALEQGREVFAMPGSIHNPLARGCHALIRDGAKLVETGEHVLEELGALAGFSLCQPCIQESRNEVKKPTDKADKLSIGYGQLLDAMGFEAISVNQLVDRSGLTPEEVCSMLLVLELDNYVVSGAGGHYTRSR